MSGRRALALTLILVLTVTIGGGCGSGGGSTSAGPTSSTGNATQTAAPATGACTLLTTDEIAAALGVQVQIRSASSVTCEYREPGGDQADVIVLVDDAASGSFDREASHPDAPLSTIAGLGDRAFFISAIGSLSFEAHGKFVEISVRRRGQADTKESEVLPLAQAVVHRI